MSKGDAKAKKVEYFDRLRKLLNEYPKILVVEADNVGSQQMHQTRISLRGQAIITMGKNTMMRKVIRQETANNATLEKLMPLVVGNVGFVFTKGDLRDVREKLIAQRVAAPAKAGAIAPLDVFVDPLNTGMGPEKTSFFQALGIATKITKGTIEILNRVHLVTKGNKVGPSEASLLNMLNVSPFTYGLQIRSIYDSGSVYGPEILDITDDILLAKFATGVANVASLSLAAGIPTAASAGHSIINGFRKLLAVAAVTDITFKQAEKMKEYLADPSKFAVAAAPAASAAPAAAAAPAKEEKKEESDEDMGFGLFD